jgi:hypothetical protein
MYNKKNPSTKRKPNFSRFFQHFASLSRNQDHEGNNTPASDDRGGRNFHLPNICTIIFDEIVLFLQLLYFTPSFFLFSKHLLFAPIHRYLLHQKKFQISFIFFRKLFQH